MEREEDRVTTEGVEHPGADGTGDSEARRRQRRGTRQLLIARTGMMASGYLVAMILARGLGPAEYGVYGFIVSAIVWLQMLVTAGIPGATSKLIPEHLRRSAAVESSARFLLAVSSVVCVVVGWVVAPVLARVFDINGGTALIRIAVFEVPLTAMYVGYQGILSGHRRFGPLALAHVVYATAKLIGITLLLVLGVSLRGAILVNVISTAVVFAYLFVRFPPRRWWPERQLMRPILAIAVPMGLYLVLQQIMLSVDLWSLKALWRGAEDVVGFYVASLTLSRTLLIVPGVQSGIVFTLTAWALARDDEAAAAEHLTEATRFVLLLIAPAAVFLGMNAAPVLSLIFSTPYAAGAAFLVLHLTAFGLFALLDTFLHCLMAAGKQKLSAAILVAIVPAVATATVLLIPRLGPRGAAISLVSGVALATLVAGVLTLRRFGRLVRLRTLLSVTAAIALVAVPSHWIPAPGVWVLLKLVLLEAACLALLLAFREVSKADFVLPSVGNDEEPT